MIDLQEKFNQLPAFWSDDSVPSSSAVFDLSTFVICMANYRWVVFNLEALATCSFNTGTIAWLY